MKLEEVLNRIPKGPYNANLHYLNCAEGNVGVIDLVDGYATQNGRLIDADDAALTPAYLAHAANVLPVLVEIAREAHQRFEHNGEESPEDAEFLGRLESVIAKAQEVSV